MARVVALVLSRTSWILPFLAVAAHAEPRRVESQPAGSPGSGLSSAYGRVPLAFQENLGQVDPRVHFTARGLGVSTLLTDAGVVVALAGGDRRTPRSSISRAAAACPTRVRREGEGAVFRIRAVGAAAPARPVGIEALPGTANYFVGNSPSRWRTGIRTYSKVMLQAVYPGVDLVFYGKQRQLEYDFVVAPGSDVGAIRLAFEGVDDLRLNQDGDLVLTIGGRELIQHRPVAYQDGDGRSAASGGRGEIDASYVIVGEREIAFRVIGRDIARRLVVDPVLAYSTYLGGSFNDEIAAIAVDRWGEALVAGTTVSIDFPVAHPIQPFQGGGTYDAFVSKLNAAGDALVYSTYLGGMAEDGAMGIAVDLWGNAYVTGDTASPDFPTVQPFQPTLGGIVDAFVAKIDRHGNTLGYSSFLGGSRVDVGSGVAVSFRGEAYVTGGTASDDFPTEHPLQRVPGGGGDAVVAKVARDGRSLVYSTYLGGTSADVGNGIAVDWLGRAYLIGDTSSHDFPTVNPLQPALGGGPFDESDAFVARLSPGGQAIEHSTYLGGSGFEQGTSIAADLLCGAFVTGNTFSLDFPTENALQPVSGAGGGDAFAARLSCRGDRLLYSTYLGGSAEDRGLGIAVDLWGRAHVAGFTYSPDFPLVSSIQPPAGDADAYLLQLSPDGRALGYSTRLGGSSFEAANAIAVDGWGNAYVAGFTLSANFPTVDPIQPADSVGGWVAKVSSGWVPLEELLGEAGRGR